jgi:hypothetical protein
MSLTVAFLTPSIHGHSNVHLTILRRLLADAGRQGRPSITIHIIGDETARKQILSLPRAMHASITFHAMGEDDLFMGCVASANVDMNTVRAPPASVFRPGGLDSIRSVAPIVTPPATLYVPRFVRIVEVLKETRPSLFVVDLLYQTLGVDAARNTGVRYMIVAPVCSLDLCQLEQPLAKGLWKYPM